MLVVFYVTFPLPAFPGSCEGMMEVRYLVLLIFFLLKKNVYEKGQQLHYYVRNWCCTLRCSSYHGPSSSPTMLLTWYPPRAYLVGMTW